MHKSVIVLNKSITEFNIVCPSAADTPEYFAATEMAKYLALTVGGEFTVKESADRPRILVGSLACGERHIYDDPSEDGFTIDISDEEILIEGGVRGTIYGVYSFLEDYLGWRFLAHDCEILKEGDVCISEPKTDTQIPKFEWRDAYHSCYFPVDIAVKRKINSNNCRGIPENKGGSFAYPGRFIHTMESLLGIPQHEMPCLTDEATIEKCIENVRTLLRENPNARVISVSQNDAEMDEEIWCTCDSCRELDEKEGSHAASLLHFVNRIAEAIEEEFPKVKIMTLAYLESIECPKTIRPRDNVIIELAPIKHCHIHSVDNESCPLNDEARLNLENWSRITDKIYVWEYFVDFSFTVPHFPNYHTLWDTMHYYSNYSVTGMFCESDNCNEKTDNTTDLSEMRNYLLSKMLWNIDLSREEYEQHKIDFLDGYYGGAGKWIAKYLDILKDVVDLPDHHIKLFENPRTMVPVDRYVAALPEMCECWDNAVKEDLTEAQQSHLERAKLGFDHLRLLFTYNDEYAAADDEKKAQMAEENRKYYELLKKYEISPRGYGTELPEVTDFTLNIAEKIYW